MLLEDLAKDLVSVTSELVGGRTINIMNTEGIIIASTETVRIGSFHQGALEAVQTGKPVNIRKDQLSAYPGAKEGCNMPLRVSGSIIGVVGICGDPPEIQYLAHLLEVYAAKYYQLEAMVSPRLAESELRGRILRHLLSPTDTSIANATALMSSQRIHLALPAVVAVVSHCSGAPMTSPQDKLLPALVGKYVLPDQDIWGIVDDKLVLLLSHRETSLPDALRQADSPEAESFLEYRFSCSGPCGTLWDIQNAYEQASILDSTAPDLINDLQQLPTRCHYMLTHTATVEAQFLDSLYEKLTTAFPSPEQKTLLQTAQCYYDMGRSVSQAANVLFIHKNTLQYRVRRLLEALELTHCTDFQQEYLVRLLLEHYKRKQGLRALE